MKKSVGNFYTILYKKAGLFRLFTTCIVGAMVDELANYSYVTPPPLLVPVVDCSLNTRNRAVNRLFFTQKLDAKWYHSGIEKLVPRYKCLDFNGTYVEK